MQVVRRWQESLNRYVERNSGAIMLLGALFVMGVVFGALAVGGLGGRDKQELVQYLSQAGHTLRSSAGGPEAAMLFWHSVAGHLKLLAVMWVLGISVIGALGIMAISFLRGFVTGFVVGFLSAEMGWRGVLMGAAGHLPQSLVEVPTLILAGSASVAFSRIVFRSWRERRRMPNFYRTLWQYTAVLVAAGFAMGVASLVEAAVSPVLLRMAMRVG